MEVSPSRSIEKMLIFPTYEHSHTLLIEKPVNLSQPSYGATYENQAFSHPSHSAACENHLLIGFLQREMQLLFSGKFLLPSFFKNLGH
jgi:hypothetical protein